MRCLRLSPILGGSILITSAPKSERMVVETGPAIKLHASMTFKPFNNNLSDIQFKFSIIFNKFIIMYL